MKYEVTYRSGRVEHLMPKNTKHAAAMAADLNAAKAHGSVLNFRAVKDSEWLPEGRKVPVSVGLDPVVKDRLRQEAVNSGKSMSEVAAKHIVDGTSKEGPKDGMDTNN